MKHHWMEEAQHAKLDTLIVDALAEGRTEERDRQGDRRVLRDRRLPRRRAEGAGGFNLDALEKAIGRKLENRAEIEAQQHQAARWTYVGSGMVHERFKATLSSISANAAARIAEAAPVFA